MTLDARTELAARFVETAIREGGVPNGPHYRLSLTDAALALADALLSASSPPEQTKGEAVTWEVFRGSEHERPRIVLPGGWVMWAASKIADGHVAALVPEGKSKTTLRVTVEDE